MIKLKAATDERMALQHSPLLRAAAYILDYSNSNGGVGLTAKSAFKRDFVHQAVESMMWPRFGVEEAYRVNKVLNEHDVVPLQVLHHLLMQMRIARHYKSKFQLTSFGRKMLLQKTSLFDELIPFFLFDIDHTSYSRFDERPYGNWDVWFNVLNVELEKGPSVPEIYSVFYEDTSGEDNTAWRDRMAFSSCVLRPLEWSGFISRVDTYQVWPPDSHYFKTPLWNEILCLDTDDLAKMRTRH